MCDEKIQSLIENLTDNEMKIMFHTLGYDFTSRWNSKTGGYRNYFYTSENTQDGRIIKKLIEKDCMCLMQESPWKEKVNYYKCTDKGKDIILELCRRRKKADKLFRKLRKALDIVLKLKNAEDELLMEVRKICAFEIDSVLYKESDEFVATNYGEATKSDYSVSDIIALYIRLQHKIEIVNFAAIRNIRGYPF